jgi:hypothetical protein
MYLNEASLYVLRETMWAVYSAVLTIFFIGFRHDFLPAYYYLKIGKEVGLERATPITPNFLISKDPFISRSCNRVASIPNAYP